MVSNTFYRYPICVAKKLLATYTDNDLVIEDTIASGQGGSMKFVWLTQRLTYRGDVVCYIQYRMKQTWKGKLTRFSSIAVLDSSFNEKTQSKFHLEDFGEQSMCDQAYTCITHQIEAFKNNIL